MGDHLTEYERERARKIERNNEKLRELGCTQLKDTIAVAAAKPKSKRSKQQEPIEHAERRRSSRLEALTTGTPAELVDAPLPDDNDDFEAKPKKQRRHQAPPGERPPAAPGSCRAMDALAEEVRSEFLGRLVPPPEGSGAMKASVMARLRGSATPPSHNKYSGIQEWLNAVVLFVNVASAKGQFYDNLFLEGGRRMTWFAQPNHVRETPAIARILATGAAEDGAAGRAGGEDGAAGGGAAPVPVLLFCRQEGEAYVCCGRVRCVSLDEASQPLKFVLELADFDEAKKHADFRGLMSAALKTGGGKK